MILPDSVWSQRARGDDQEVVPASGIILGLNDAGLKGDVGRQIAGGSLAKSAFLAVH
jgi:hypothetical protein